MEVLAQLVWFSFSVLSDLISSSQLHLHHDPKRGRLALSFTFTFSFPYPSPCPFSPYVLVSSFSTPLIRLDFTTAALRRFLDLVDHSLRPPNLFRTSVRSLFPFSSSKQLSKIDNRSHPRLYWTFGTVWSMWIDSSRSR